MTEQKKVDFHPHDLEGYIGNDMHVLTNATKLPKALLNQAGGILLISSHAAGFLLFSSETGAGVAMARNKDGAWSAPIAVTLENLGWGTGIGWADKDTLILLNHVAMKRLLEGNFQAKLGVGIGVTVGSHGGVGNCDLELSDKGGVGTSIAYTWSKGAMLNLEVKTGAIGTDPNASKFFYMQQQFNVAEIFDGTVRVPEGSSVNKLWEKIASLQE